MEKWKCENLIHTVEINRMGSGKKTRICGYNFRKKASKEQKTNFNQNV